MNVIRACGGEEGQAVWILRDMESYQHANAFRVSSFLVFFKQHGSGDGNVGQSLHPFGLTKIF